MKTILSKLKMLTKIPKIDLLLENNIKIKIISIFLIYKKQKLNLKLKKV